MADAPVPFSHAPGGGVPFALPTGVGHLLAAAGDTGGAISVVELVIRAGEGPGLHVHGRDHEIWYVLDGDFRFRLDDDVVARSTGGFVFGPRGVPHTFRNDGGTDGRLLVVSTPSGLEEFFLDWTAAGEPEGLEALAASARLAGVEFVGPPLGPLTADERTT
ncbi:cupin [Pseudonocardia sulfidoxydans NBRC 16205]|uniref:Cupin n=1 Tax=Pseudonocardia sulfidoxydans NBRC 16205 TaxID=1223511 RepID=A0A511DDL3_9PSEU|nr:cupin domain-containing protein [Pseudonocardia sulfidoxydans]GEL22617.1 cupin [Pseudonocardia sulfidoxydans NBRC 16205]